MRKEVDRWTMKIIDKMGSELRKCLQFDQGCVVGCVCDIYTYEAVV